MGKKKRNSPASRLPKVVLEAREWYGGHEDLVSSGSEGGTVLKGSGKMKQASLTHGSREASVQAREKFVVDHVSALGLSCDMDEVVVNDGNVLSDDELVNDVDFPALPSSPLQPSHVVANAQVCDDRGKDKELLVSGGHMGCSSSDPKLCDKEDVGNVANVAIANGCGSAAGGEVKKSSAQVHVVNGGIT